MMLAMSIHPITHLVRNDDVAIVPTWTLGDRMRKALEVTGTPVHEMAEYLEVSRQTIGRWLADRGPVKRSTLVIWAAATGVDLEWLETGTASPKAGRSSYAIRDLNPEPADMEHGRFLTLVHSVNRPLTVDRIPAGWPIPEPRKPLPGRESDRHLSAVS